jgi:uncharacterized repeat protein (TIGR01451 family)
MGAFDSNGDGFVNSISVGFFNRDTTSQIGTLVTFIPGTAAPLVNGDRIADLPPGFAFILPVGHYSIVAVGFSSVDLNGNALLSGFTPSAENTGGGLITFVGNGRYDSNTTLDFPTTCVGCPASPTNLFLAGTFKFQAVVAPSITKTFSTPFGPVNPGDQSTITIAITNPNAAALTGVAFMDTLPTGLVFSTPSGLTNTCGGVAAAVTAGPTLSLSGGTIAASSSCTVTANVTNQAIVGSLTNPAITVTSNEAPNGVSTPATLSVDPLYFLWFFFST